jgi:hypothetical protein
MSNLTQHRVKELFNYDQITGKLTHVADKWMTGVIPSQDIDHEDRHRANNVWTNLREGSRSQNLTNQGLKHNNRSGFKGVTSRGNSHSVRFRVNRKVIHIGSFSTAKQAAEVYDWEVVKYQGVYAKTNKSLGLLP